MLINIHERKNPMAPGAGSELALDRMAGRRPMEPQAYDPWNRFLLGSARAQPPRSECECTMAQLEAELFDPSLR